MTAAITVGFQPAAAPALGAPVAAATTTAGQPAGETGLFATLLALLAPGLPSAPSELTLPAGLSAPLQQGLAKAGALSPDDLEARLTASAEKLGIDLTALEDLLAGLASAPETPADPKAIVEGITGLAQALAAMPDAAATEGSGVAGEDRLEAAVDALLALLDVPAPAPSPPPTTGETFSELVGDLTEALTGQGTPAADAPGASPILDDAASADATAPAAAAAAAAPVTSVTEIDKASGDTTRPAIVDRLTQLLERTAEAVAPTNPQLADKLTALAKALPALPDKVLAALETTGEDGAETAAPQLASLLDQAARPRSAQRPVPAPLFTAPTLDTPVPEASGGRASESGSSPSPSPAPRPATLDNPSDQATLSAPAAARGDTAPQRAPTAQPAPAADPTDAGAEPAADATSPPPGAASAPQSPVAAPAAYRAVQAAYQPPAMPISLPQVAFEIARQFEAGNTRFQIRLDPAELGRIDVQLDLDRSGAVHARMVVERPETLDLLQRDHRALQQALQQAGLDSNRTNLEFSLRQNPFAGEGTTDGRQQGQSGRQGGERLGGETGADPIPEIYRGVATPGALNLFV